MKKSVAISLFLAATLSAFGEIDLTPVSRETVANGTTFKELTFRDDKQRIDYEPPQTWTFDGAGSQLRLKPKQTLSEALVLAAPLTKPQSFDDNTTKLLEQQFLAGLPVGSQFAKVEEEVANPVLLSGHESFEITVSYQSMGEKFLRSALFVNTQNTHLTFRLTARQADFPALHREFKTSLFTWRWVEREQNAAADATKSGQLSAQ